MVSAICPNCKIVLVQTNNNYTSSLYTGVKTAGRLGAKYIGASWGGPESGGDNPIFHQHGVVIVAAAGDNGGGGRYHGGPQQPCSYTYVVCAGGTRSRARAQRTRGWSESRLERLDVRPLRISGSSPCGATGSGCSTKIAKAGVADRYAVPHAFRIRRLGDGVAAQPGGRLQFGGRAAYVPILLVRLRRHERVDADHLGGLRARRQCGDAKRTRRASGSIRPDTCNDVSVGNNVASGARRDLRLDESSTSATPVRFRRPDGLGNS